MKKVLSIVLAAMLILSICCSSALACGNNGRGQAATKQNFNYGQLRSEVKGSIKKTVDSAKLALAEAAEAAANAAIAGYVAYAQMTPWNDIKAMQKNVTATVETTRAYVNALGFDLECEYTSYYVDGQWVEVDPIHVINWP